MYLKVTWLFVLDPLDHLVKVKRHRQFLSALTICIHDEMVTFFVNGPDSTLVHVASINTGSAFNRYAK
jgi:hypothetical protein